MSGQSSVFYKWGGGLDPDYPRIAKAKDEFLVTEDGTEIVDAAAGAAVVNLGHGGPGVTGIMSEQMADVSYISLSHFSHEAPERLASTIVSRTADPLESVFFSNSGSEANEMAFKLARAYHRENGRTDKNKIIGRWQSYHGATLGALSASGNTSRRTAYDPMLQGWPHIPAAYPYRWTYEGSSEEQAIAAAKELEIAINQEGAHTVAAFVAEPVSGASIPAAHPHPAYFQEIRRICDEYDVLFIADEIMTGFGRTGTLFAMDHYDVVPDMMTLGKGLSNGCTPISATVIQSEIASVFDTESDSSFAHGHTYSGNPVSAAIAAHVVDQYTESILETGRKRGELLASELEPLCDHPMVGDFRHIGAMIGIEFVADTDSKRPFDPELAVHERVYERALEQGVYTYPGSGSVDGVAGDHLMLSPPLTISEESVRTIASVIIESVEEVYDTIGS